MHRRRAPFVAFLLLLLAAPGAAAQVAAEAVDLDVVQQIRQEGLENSRIEELARHLTEAIGPRLTGSPQMKEANEWTAGVLGAWGLENVTVEPWGLFGRGWEPLTYSGQILSPWSRPLHARPVAWTGSTDGPVRGPVVVVRVETVEALEEYRGRLSGAFLLAEEPTEVEPEWEPVPRRTPLEELLVIEEAGGSRADGAGADGPGADGPGADGPGTDGSGADGEAGEQQREQQRAQQRLIEELRRRHQINTALAELAREEGAVALLRPSSRNYGMLRGGGNAAGLNPAAGAPLPELVVAREQYNTLWRSAEAGLPVELEVGVENRFHEEDLRAYNTLADLPGSDLADELVMIGAHLDSWHYGQGATDNAAGSVVMMEAMRILSELDLPTRRTIRIALWSGEEQGLLGSRAWVTNHPELHDRISVYLNVDNGTGRLRGIWSQSNERAIPIFEQLLWPFRDLGVVAVRHGDTGGTDHLAFDAAGIPGFNFIQDPVEYHRTHHSDLDTFDHLVLEDLKQAAVVVAATAWHLANQDEMMPRKGSR